MVLMVLLQPTGKPQTPAEQLPMTQSSPVLHVLPVAHLGQPEPPPQSTSVSKPFLTLSWHLAASHTPPVHTKLAQSVPTPHFLPGAHLGHPEVPPQSTSVSF
jgi:hypothetical protein